MSFSRGPQIVTNGLILYLDFANTKSYPATGSIVFDRTVNGYNGVLTNGPTFSSNNFGYLGFDGINDMVVTQLSTLSTSNTWDIWVNRTSNANAFNMMMGMFLPYFAFNSSNQFFFSNSVGASQQSIATPGTYSDNTWYHVTFVSDYNGSTTTMKIYVNSVFSTQGVFTGQQVSTTTNSFRLGQWNTDNSYSFNGKIGSAKIYNRVLTQAEITQNFDAIKSRYL